MEDIKVISLASSFLIPFFWTISILLSDKIRYASNKHLLFLFLTATFMYIMVYAKFQGYIHFYTLLFPMQGFACAILFPLFYLYVYLLTSEKIVYDWKYYIHYAMPVIFLITTFLIFKAFLGKEEEIMVMTNILESKSPEGSNYTFAYQYYDFGKFYFMLSSVVYMLLIFFRYNYNKKNIENIYSSDKYKELRWIKTIGYLLLISVLFNLIIQYISNIDVSHNNLLLSISYFTFSLFFWFLGLYSYHQKEIYDEKKVQKIQVLDEGIKINRNDIIKYLEDEKPYLKPDISIYDLCYVFNTNRTYLSESINKLFNVNFRTLINKYRVEEAKNMMLKMNTNNTTVLLEEVALQSGFNSYSSFLRVFKMFEGTPPSDYVKSLHIDNEDKNIN